MLIPVEEKYSNLHCIHLFCNFQEWTHIVKWGFTASSGVHRLTLLKLNEDVRNYIRLVIFKRLKSDSSPQQCNKYIANCITVIWNTRTHFCHADSPSQWRCVVRRLIQLIKMNVWRWTRWANGDRKWRRPAARKCLPSPRDWLHVVTREDSVWAWLNLAVCLVHILWSARFCFVFQNMQTVSGAHLASYRTRPAHSFPSDKIAVAWNCLSPPASAELMKKWSCTSTHSMFSCRAYE